MEIPYDWPDQKKVVDVDTYVSANDAVTVPSKACCLAIQEHEVEYRKLLPELQAAIPRSTSTCVDEVLPAFVLFLRHNTW
jgi:hypothetical protein